MREGLLVSCPENAGTIFLSPNLHQTPQLHHWIYSLAFPKQHPNPKFWTFTTDVFYCLFPEAVKINQLQYLNLERERFLAREERISPLGTGKMEKYLEHSLIASTSLVTTCQTAQITCDHHGEAPKKGKDVRQNLGGVLVCWGWGFLLDFLGVWFGF